MVNFFFNFFNLHFFSYLKNIEDEILKNPERKNEMVQIIIQTLENFGYTKSSNFLKKESNVEFETENLTKFRNLIMEAKFDEVYYY